LEVQWLIGEVLAFEKSDSLWTNFRIGITKLKLKPVSEPKAKEEELGMVSRSIFRFCKQRGSSASPWFSQAA
jgi:hypothetical protein